MEQVLPENGTKIAVERARAGPAVVMVELQF